MIDRMNEETVRAMLEAMPLETTVIDAKDEVIGWNKHETRIFHRPMTSMGLNFRDCHPQESLAKVEQIVSEMRSGAAGQGPVLDRLRGRARRAEAQDPHRVLRPAGREGAVTSGCMECTQDVQDIIGLTGQKRLLD